MNATASYQATAVAIAGIATTLRQRDDLATTWRENLLRLAEHERFIKAYAERIAEAEAGKRYSNGSLIHNPVAVAVYRDRLPDHCAGWRDAIRRVVEAEAEMDRIGMAYAKSSDDWRV